jgi:hypothetical protein
MAEMERGAWSGWVAFTGTLLVVTGALNVFEGFIALIWDDHVVMTPSNLVVVDLTGWAWVILLSGLLLLAAGFGVATGQTWGRVTGIVLVALHALTQIAWLSAYPVWSLLMIAMDVAILFALTVHWSDAWVRERNPATPLAGRG